MGLWGRKGNKGSPEPPGPPGPPGGIENSNGNQNTPDPSLPIIKGEIKPKHLPIWDRNLYTAILYF